MFVKWKKNWKTKRNETSHRTNTKNKKCSKMDKKFTNHRSSENLFKKSKQNSLKNLQNILPEIKLILDSIKSNFSDLKLSCSPINMSDSDVSSFGDPLSLQVQSLSHSNFRRISHSSNSDQNGHQIDQKTSQQLFDILIKVYKNSLLINVLMTQFKTHLKALKTTSIQSSKSLQNFSRTDSNGYRRPAVFNYLLNLQNHGMVDRCSEYLGPGLLENLEKLHEMWDDFYSEHIIILGKFSQKSTSSTAIKTPRLGLERSHTQLNLLNPKNHLTQSKSFTNIETNNQSDEILSEQKKEFEEVKKFVTSFGEKIRKVIRDFDEEVDE